jgi:hypothetical protein
MAPYILSETKIFDMIGSGRYCRVLNIVSVQLAKPSIESMLYSRLRVHRYLYQVSGS